MYVLESAIWLHSPLKIYPLSTSSDNITIVALYDEYAQYRDKI